MYSANDLILDIGESFNLDDNLREIYRREFQGYSEGNLLKIRGCILDNHGYANAPKLGKIFSYMKESSIPRKSRNKRSWMHCNTCGTDYPIKTSLCPTCAWKGQLNLSETVVKNGDDYPDTMKHVNHKCPHCRLFIGQKEVPRGALCDAWQCFDATIKSDKMCLGCPCHSCCNESVKDNTETDHIVSRQEDHYWVTFYENKEVEKGSIVKFSGTKYKNTTGKYKGTSPRADKDNWEVTR